MRIGLILSTAVLALGLAACKGGIGVGSMQLLELGSPPTVQETQLLGDINARLETLEKQANDLVNSKVLSSDEMSTLTGAENEAKDAVDALRRDPRDTGERLAAQNQLTKYQAIIDQLKNK